jgi:hypothetical protein
MGSLLVEQEASPSPNPITRVILITAALRMFVLNFSIVYVCLFSFRKLVQHTFCFLQSIDDAVAPGVELGILDLCLRLFVSIANVRIFAE